MATAARLDDPGALGGGLTGVSFIGGLATGLSLADASFPRPGADIKDIQRSSRATPAPSGSTSAASSLSAASLAVFSASVTRLAARTRTGPGRCTGSCSQPVGRSTAPGWRCCLPKAALVVPAGRFPTFIVLGTSGTRLARGAGAG